MWLLRVLLLCALRVLLLCPLRVLLLCPLRALLLCPLRVLLLWALLYPGTGNVPSVQEEIFTRPGSDLLLPIRRHLTLTHPDTKRCDGIVWRFTDPTEYYGTTIFIHRGCTLRKYENALFPNMKISENGSLIISNVTPENDRIYRVDIYNSTGDIIQKDYYSVHVEVPLSDITVTSSCLPDGSAVAECSVKGSDPRYSWSLDGRSVSSHSRVTLPPPVSGTLRCDVTNQINHLSRSINIFCPVPVSDPVLDVKCLQNGSAEISCSVEKGNDPSIYLTVIGELEVYDVTGSERTVRVTVPPVSPPDSWNISCSAKNDISERSTNQTQDACPGKIRSLLGHLLSPIAVFVLYTALLIFMVNDLRKMKNEKNLSERRMRRRDQVEMEMEPTYYNDRN
ncbi:uncharacterized protein LOC120921619 isoform X3 [Rana temporaria]|uniref:uncharacterized protein LOC120921619 isoform X3 n=1 Tax=Rana temporaria TaxID=8407 RepID=UPI001AAD945D|nr:uncharacterized protein LOC120921619 isoform X3 [Rana temporaria]